MDSLPSSGVRLSLEEARRLATDRQWQTLVEHASRVPQQALLREPELAFHVSDGLWRIGQSAEALDLAELIESTTSVNGNRWLRLNLINVIGIALFELGRGPEAEERFSQLLDYATEWGNDEFAARASNNLGVLANIRGRRDLALTYYQRALAAYQRLGYIRGLAQTHYNLGISYRDLGFERDADTHYARAISHAENSASEDVLALAETERAALRAHAGDGSLAESMARRALRRFQRMGDPTGAAQATRVLASAARVNGQDERAAMLLDQAFATAQLHSDLLLRAEVQRDRGLLLRDQGDHPGAQAALHDAALHFSRLGADREAQAVRALSQAL